MKAGPTLSFLQLRSVPAARHRYAPARLPFSHARFGAAWVALCAIPITAGVFWRYGMKAAEEIRQEESLYAKQNTDFPTANPLTN